MESGMKELTELLDDTLENAGITNEKDLVDSMVEKGVSALDISHLILVSYRSGVEFGLDTMSGAMAEQLQEAIGKEKKI